MLGITSEMHAWRARSTAPIAGIRQDTIAAGARPAFAAVLFADIVGFTRHCEVRPPSEAFALLSEFHRRMSEVLTVHVPSVEDAIGDGVMAAWSGAEPASSHAACALACAFAMLDVITSWNDEHSGDRVKVGIGLHAGAVTFGRICTGGGTKCGVFGDTVNITHRLERMTRTLGSDLVASDALFRMVRAVAPDDALLERFQPAATARLPGRTRPLLVRAASS